MLIQRAQTPGAVQAVEGITGGRIALQSSTAVRWPLALDHRGMSAGSAMTVPGDFPIAARAQLARFADRVPAQFSNVTRADLATRAHAVVARDAGGYGGPHLQPRAALFTASALLLSGCGDGAVDPATMALWGALGVSLIGSGSWHVYTKRLIASLPERFRAQAWDYYVRIEGTPIVNFGVIGWSTLLFFIGMIGTGGGIEQAPYGALGLQLLTHIAVAWKTSALKQEVNAIITEIPDHEFKLTNANDPATQVEILMETPVGMLNRLETFTNPRKFAAVMTGVNGILYSEPFAGLSVKHKLKVLTLCQEKFVASLDSDIVTSYLKALAVLLAKDATLAKKASPLIQQLARCRVTLADPDDKAAQSDPVQRLLCLMAIYKHLFGMYQAGVPAVVSALNNHAPDLALLFDSNKDDPAGDGKLMDLLEAQIRARLIVADEVPAGQLGVKLARPGADLTALFSDDLPRYTLGEQGAIVAGALRMILERRDADDFNRFMTDCEIHLPKKFWEEHGTNVKNLLSAAREEAVEEMDVALKLAITNVGKLRGEKASVAGKTAAEKALRDRAISARIAVIRQG